MEQVQEVLKLRGALRIVLNGPSGEVVQERLVENLVVTPGRSWLMFAMAQGMSFTQPISSVGLIAIGSSTVAPNATDTGLGLLVTFTSSLTASTANTTANPPNVQWQCSFATNIANTTLAEVGIFFGTTTSASTSASLMLGHATFASIIKATSNTLNISYTISD